MSKSDNRDPKTRVTLEYTGKDGRCYRNLPTLNNGDTVQATPKMADSLIATGKFQVVKKKAGSNSPAVSQDKGVNDNE